MKTSVALHVDELVEIVQALPSGTPLRARLEANVAALKKKRALEELRHEIEGISSEFWALVRGSSDKNEKLLASAVADHADAAREKLLDVSVAMAKYVSFCIDRERHSLDV